MPITNTRLEQKLVTGNHRSRTHHSCVLLSNTMSSTRFERTTMTWTSISA